MNTVGRKIHPRRKRKNKVISSKVKLTGIHVYPAYSNGSDRHQGRGGNAHASRGDTSVCQLQEYPNEVRRTKCIKKD